MKLRYFNALTFSETWRVGEDGVESIEVRPEGVVVRKHGRLELLRIPGRGEPMEETVDVVVAPPPVAHDMRSPEPPPPVEVKQSTIERNTCAVCGKLCRTHAARLAHERVCATRPRLS